MRKLLDKYGSSGFQVLAFPCNQFGEQAPCSSECEREYLYVKLNTTEGALPVTVFDKAIVNGPGTLDVYAVVKHVANLGANDVAWNYEKFLLDGEGKPFAR